MVPIFSPLSGSARSNDSVALRCAIALAVATLLMPAAASAQQGPVRSAVIQNISKPNDRLEMTVNTSRILTLESRIPRIVVTNPEIVSATPISENQVQIAARKPGVTQINLWDEEGKIYTVDLLIFGDVRELDLMLKKMFPESTIQVIRLSQSLVLEGQVDRPEIVTTVRQLAEDYAPKLINNLRVGGVQQVLLKVKIMEVSRTKLRKLGFDFSSFSGGDFVASSVSGILQSVDNAAQTVETAGQTIAFGVVDGGDAFFGVLEALQQNQLAKTLADPTLVTVSGRPASFNVGGEVFFQINNGVAGSSVESEKFGTEVHFVPIVMGDGMIRLEVHPKISEIDQNKQIGNTLFTTRVSEVDTGVELAAGQTLALAGLVQTRVNAEHRGLPFVSDIPYIGAAFRKVTEEVEEIELLIMVTPEFVDGLSPEETPCCGPGMETVSPGHCDLYMKGFIEVPSCGPCGAGVGPVGPGCQCGPVGGQYGTGGYLPSTGQPSYGFVEGGQAPIPGEPAMPVPAEIQGPEATSGGSPPSLPSPEPAADSLPDPSAANRPLRTNRAYSGIDVYNRNNTPRAATRHETATNTPGLIGPIGYDVQK